MAGPLFALGSPEALRLKAHVSDRLSSHGLDDENLSEYVLVLLANNKSAAQVAAELQSIVGDELPASFTEWLFSTMDTVLQTGSGTAVAEGAAGDGAAAKIKAEPGLDPSAVEFTPESGEDTAMDISGRQPVPPKAPYRLLDKALRDATTSAGPTVSASSEAVRSKRPAPYVKEARADRQAERQQRSKVTESATTFTVTLAGQSAVERVDARPVRCVYWPSCNKGLDCPFWHPSEVCPNLPDCPEGDKCLYVHPTNSAQCKYGYSCTNPRCQYSHPSPALRKPAPTSYLPRPAKPIPCKFSPCLNPACPYVHDRSQQLGFANKTLVVGSSGVATSVSEIPCKVETRALGFFGLN